MACQESRGKGRYCAGEAREVGEEATVESEGAGEEIWLSGYWRELLDHGGVSWEPAWGQAGLTSAAGTG